MLRLPNGGTNDYEKDLLRRLRVWIAALAIACVATGIGIGALLSGSPVIAQPETSVASTATAPQIARAPEALSASFAEIARRVEPAVVNIDTVAAPAIAGRSSNNDDEMNDDDDESATNGNKKNGGNSSNNNNGDGNNNSNNNNNNNNADKNKSDDTDAEDADSRLLDELKRRMRQAPRGVGSGFIVDGKGLILTNNHVIEGATTINVKLQSGETLRGRVVGTDEETDLAVIKVDATRELPTVKLGNSNDVQVGDWVLAIGSPFGLEQTVTAGIISTKDRGVPEQGAAGLVRFIQTDAAINRGNSGGPLVNMRGEVIGINSQIATTTGDYNGIGFAVPSDDATFVYRQLTGEGNRVRRGYLGLGLLPVRNEFARVYNLPETRGAIVNDIPTSDAPAPRAGMQIGDIITEFNNQPIRDSTDLISKVASTPVGTAVQITYLRENNGAQLERRTANITLGERPLTSSRARENALSNDKNTKPKNLNERPRLGLMVSDLTQPLANDLNLNGVRGVLVRRVDDGGLADSAGLTKDIVIQRINRQNVNSMQEFERIIGSLKTGDAVVMHVAAYNGTRIVQNVLQFTFQ